MENRLGQIPAFACSSSFETHYGMSKRFYAACAAMQGMLANSSTEITVKNAKDYSEMAYDFADELLKQENI